MTQLKKLLTSNKIEFVLFDMDSTLVDTKTYYKEEMANAIVRVVSDISPTLPLRKQLRITKEILKISHEIYTESNSPLLINTLTFEAIQKYYNSKSVELDTKKIFQKLSSIYEDFYISSPSLFPYTLNSIKKLHDLGINMGVYSHAQKIWTKIKVEKIKDEYFNKYGKKLNLKFFTTKIEDSKDKEGWSDAGEYFKLNFEKTLAVGDNLDFDIYSAIEAGYKYLVYLSHSSEKVPLKNSKNAKVFVIKNIKELL